MKGRAGATGAAAGLLPVVLLLSLLTAPLLAAPPLAAPGIDPACGDTTLVVEQAGRVVFDLRSNDNGAGAVTPFEIDSDEPFTIRVSNVPPDGDVVVRLLLPFGQSVSETFAWSGAEPGGDHVMEVDPADYAGLASLASGAYRVEVTLNVPDRPPCSAATTVRVVDGGFKPLAVASFWAAIASGLAALAAAFWAAYTAHRRRLSSSGPAAGPPGMSFSIAGMLVTALTGGLAGLIWVIALQQRSVVPLTTTALVLGPVFGAAAALGVSVLAVVTLSMLARGRTPRGM